MNIHLETPRFLIRYLLLEDEDGMFEMDNDPEVHKYIGRRPLQTREEIRDVINYVRRQYVDNGVGRWAVVDSANNEFLGWVGFKLMTDRVHGHINHYDFGYRFKRSAWNKGVASETGKASLEYGVNVLGFKPVYAMTDVNNGASRHVLEKLGFRFVEIFDYDGPVPSWRTDDLRATWYELPETLI